MRDHADVVREKAMHYLSDFDNRDLHPDDCPGCAIDAALDALVAECEDWAVNYDDLQAKTRKQVLRAEAAEARVAALEMALGNIAIGERIPRPDGPRPGWCHPDSFHWNWLTDSEVARAALDATKEEA